MDYEKKYKEALERCKKDFNFRNLAYTHEEIKQRLEHVFPELRESEDEKIRKELIQYLEDYPNLPNGNYCRNDFFAWLEKQGEQKPAWSEEDDNCLSTIIAEFSKCAGKSVSKDEWMRCNDWLNSLRNKVQPQPKQEWSEEDEKVIHCLEYTVRHFYEDEDTIKWCCDWLKSIKPNHWKPSEQNIKDLEWCADLVKDKMGVGFHRLQVFIDEIKNL